MQPHPRPHQVLFEQAPRPPELLARFHEAEAKPETLVAELLGVDPAVAMPDSRVSSSRWSNR